MNAPTIILILLTWWIVYTFYRLYVRPSVLFAIRTKIRALRDEMELTAVSDAEYRHDPAYAIVRKRAEDVEPIVRLLNVSNALFIESDPLTTTEVKVQNSHIENAGGKLRSHEKKLCLYVGAAFAINAPFLSLLIACGLILFVWSAMAQRWMKSFYDRTWAIPEQSVNRQHATC